MVEQRYQWQFVGGHLVLDLVNTRSWRFDPDRDVERVPDPDRLDSWRAAAAAHHAVDLPGLASPSEYRQILDVRDTVTRWLDAQSSGAADERDAERLRRLWLESAARMRLSDRLPLSWYAPAPSVTALVDVLAMQAVELLSTESDRIRRCGLEECGWYFLDATRNHSRRWCTPDECGNLHRVRAYAARKRSAGRSPSTG
ncbi:CGNR zinc finger domain-containing protein [Nocardioides sp. CER19]|uniref:CGNR zinc finger domain-containing protein n=1 Tax=Nocardioides sp. CER19 TaxID=3038538 RepID=UPI00244CE266|nr:CGNR zinc finger domain-containing protein [Nocardioides sp. CER19]MDH2413890.1 CGNR zinc finger domain-containing protein [Nocardioides sp. CER19]